jgi:hypothetical protein
LSKPGQAGSPDSRSRDFDTRDASIAALACTPLSDHIFWDRLCEGVDEYARIKLNSAWIAKSKPFA